jgi:DNA-binding response OmpR family regulator
MPPVLCHSTILCIDDEEIELSVRKMVLETAGYVVLTATNASQGFEVFKAHHVDLVISDHLPSTSGSDFVAELRRFSPSLPIMLLSGETVFPDVVEPPDYYLHKLEGPAEMIAKVRSVIPPADEKQNRL